MTKEKVKTKQLQWNATFILSVISMFVVDFDKILPFMFLAFFAILKCSKWGVFGG